ncbi:nitronate monooxygenase [Nakamurella antarctica]|uniref:Nitronate monooxygenase n=1 Tax=Nakamurella antarctica TaxID=1902245 RepID=A0A3G8ZKF8_9ACTN|nr:nitronate monooxygenase [Nakamurella antarctica]AZI57267.1 nitronate monooxygenase [Nakamurella antarctica]
MRTWLTEQFDLTVPVVSAPMAGVAGGRLAAAVSAAGALGMIGVGSKSDPAWLDHQIDVAAAGEKPYGIGLMAWSLSRDATPGMAVLKARPDLVSISFGDVEPWVAPMHDNGVAVAAQAGNLLEAFALEDMGVDIIVVRGAEGGGHGRNEVATLPLLQAVLDNVDVPVLAAGGIGTARGLAAVLAAGAAGAWVGTAFTCCPEADTFAAAQDAIVAADLHDTTYGRIFDIVQHVPWPAEFGGRSLRNEFTAAWAGREHELEAGSAAALAAGDQVAAAKVLGDTRYAPVYAGQSAGLVQSRRPAAEVVADLACAQEYLRAAAALVG